MPHRFDDPAHWAQVFDAPDRDTWQRPEAIIAALLDRDDMTVADLGAGTGYFSVRFARHLSRGRVIASDIEPRLVAHIASRAEGLGLGNLETVLGTPGDPGLSPWRGRLDLVFLCNTTHHIGDRPRYFAALAALLAPGGRIAIVDFDDRATRGPPPGHRIAPAQLDAELAAAGLALDAAPELLPEQYLRIYRHDGRVD
jgi:SAM-dependent methyltransferase